MPQHRQPLLHDAVVALRAPAQSWSDDSGDAVDGIHGVYVSDVRIIGGSVLTVDGERPEPIAVAAENASTVRFAHLARQADGGQPDPYVRLDRHRVVRGDGVDETLTVTSRRDVPLEVVVELALRPELTQMDAVKSGLDPVLPAVEIDGDGARWADDAVTAAFTAPDAVLTTGADGILVAHWTLRVAARGHASARWAISAVDGLAVVAAPTSPAPWGVPTLAAGDTRLERWVTTALDDLDALRLTTASAAPGTPTGDQFLAAGAPWFFTLFGRDSLWAARFLLPLGTGIAAQTLRVLAGLQGAERVVETAEQPGKIMHELRRGQLEIPGEDISLPPLYYGTVDATALWVCLLHDAWRWGMPATEVEALLPALEGALGWMRDFGDADGDGLLEYVDETGRGLSNQGWKDSGDSVQWRDGTLATGPIALCEVQAYAYEAATHGADLLDAFGREGADEWRAWADRLQTRFRETFWVQDAAGAYPAIALDADKRAVDTVTSNLGHLLGTGLLDAAESALVAARLGSPELDSGYGLRTMSTESSGYWPLSYHGGTVWAHDTAIAVAGLAKDGFAAEAASLAEGLLAAAEGFGYRMPELHSGESRTEVSRPVPYPAACRPQAWSAAAAVQVLTAALGIAPTADGLTAFAIDRFAARGIDVAGIRFDDREWRVVATVDGTTVSED